jgi:hypothetical protein
MPRAPIEVATGLAASVLVAAAVLAAGGAPESLPARAPTHSTEQAGCAEAWCAPPRGAGLSPEESDARARAFLLSRSDPLPAEIDPSEADPRDPLVICTAEGGIIRCVRAPS